MFGHIIKPEHVVGTRPALYGDVPSYAETVRLFNKSIKVMPAWVDPSYSFTHLHIIATNVCSNDCSYCCEARRVKSKEVNHVPVLQVERVLTEMYAAGILKTVTLTGGEPTKHPQLDEIIRMINHFGAKVYINTRTQICCEVACHNISVDIGAPVLTDLDTHRHRLRVMLPEGAKLVDLMYFMGQYPKTTNFLFQGDMRAEAQPHSFTACVEEASRVFQHVETVVHDFYWYTVFRHKGIDITFTWSDMTALNKQEAIEDPSYCREFILEKDWFGGSWNRRKLVHYFTGEE